PQLPRPPRPPVRRRAARPGWDALLHQLLRPRSRHGAALTSRVSSSRLIGRTAELAGLGAALAEACEGRPSIALVAGESGLGKTRLLTELQERARERDALVLI